MSNIRKGLVNPVCEEPAIKNETERTRLPTGKYQATINDLKLDEAYNGAPFLAVTWIINDESVRDLTDKFKLICLQTIWLDLDESGKQEVGPNKNIDLNELRSAVGQNDDSPWSPTMLVGCSAYVHVEPDKIGQHIYVTQASSLFKKC